MRSIWFQRLAILATILAFVVIVFGAFVRLSDAGLSCPDWPTCYGKATWPAAHEIDQANSEFTTRAVDSTRAWREQVHRHLAGVLGILVLLLAVWANSADARRRWRTVIGAALVATSVILYILKYYAYSPLFAAVGLVLILSLILWPTKLVLARWTAAALFVVILQALLGMWTVTLLVKPLIVTLHLLGGLTTLALLTWISVRARAKSLMHAPRSYGIAPSWRRWITMALLVLGIQITLGGWVSTNYAALACPDFPTCQNSFSPTTDFHQGFVLWRGIGVNYEGGVLDGPARVAIHLSHRGFAIVALIMIGTLGFLLWRRRLAGWLAPALLVLLVAQISLGIANVMLGLPLWTAVLHNAVAALLLITLLLILARTRVFRRGL
jgi:heme a synthase